MGEAHPRRRSPRQLAELLHPTARARLRSDPRGFTSVVHDDDAPDPGVFEGAYGAAYDSVVQRPRLLRAAARTLWGTPTFLPDIGELVRRATAGCGEASVLLDVPCGGGTLLPMLQRDGFAGLAIAADISDAMLARAIDTSMARAPGMQALFVRCDAMRLPFLNSVADVIVSINGLHCMPDRLRFLTELRRVLRPGASAWLTTMVLDGSRRRTAVARLCERGRVIPSPPPTRDEVAHMVRDAGFDVYEDLGGTGIMGLRCS